MRHGLWGVVPWSGTETGPPAFGVQNLSCWTTREVPKTFSFCLSHFKLSFCHSLHIVWKDTLIVFKNFCLVKKNQQDLRAGQGWQTKSLFIFVVNYLLSTLNLLGLDQWENFNSFVLSPCQHNSRLNSSLLPFRRSAASLCLTELGFERESYCKSVFLNQGDLARLETFLVVTTETADCYCHLMGRGQECC